jgi:hypothetical protein
VTEWEVATEQKIIVLINCAILGNLVTTEGTLFLLGVVVSGTMAEAFMWGVVVYGLFLYTYAKHFLF